MGSQWEKEWNEVQTSVAVRHHTDTRERLNQLNKTTETTGTTRNTMLLVALRGAAPRPNCCRNPPRSRSSQLLGCRVAWSLARTCCLERSPSASPFCHLQSLWRQLGPIHQALTSILHPYFDLKGISEIPREVVRFINVILTVDYLGDPLANTEKNMKKIKSCEIYRVFNHFIYTIFTTWLMNRAHCDINMPCTHTLRDKA